MSEENNKKKNPFSIYWIYAAVGLAIIGFQLYMSASSTATITNQTFFQLAEKGYISHVFIVNNVRADFKLTKEGKDFVQNSKEGEFAKMGKAFQNQGSLKN